MLSLYDPFGGSAVAENVESQVTFCMCQAPTCVPHTVLGARSTGK